MTTTNETTERAAFEAWMKSLPGYPYAGQFANLMWDAWQARAALPPPVAEPEWVRYKSGYSYAYQSRISGLILRPGEYETMMKLCATPAPDSAADARDGERLRFAMQDIDGFGKLVMDKYDYAIQVADENGRDVPSEDDELNGIRRLIDAAMQTTTGSGDANSI